MGMIFTDLDSQRRQLLPSHMAFVSPAISAGGGCCPYWRHTVHSQHSLRHHQPWGPGDCAYSTSRSLIPTMCQVPALCWEGARGEEGIGTRSLNSVLQKGSTLVLLM